MGRHLTVDGQARRLSRCGHQRPRTVRPRCGGRSRLGQSDPDEEDQCSKQASNDAGSLPRPVRCIQPSIPIQLRSPRQSDTGGCTPDHQQRGCSRSADSPSNGPRRPGLVMMVWYSDRGQIGRGCMGAADRRFTSHEIRWRPRSLRPTSREDGRSRKRRGHIRDVAERTMRQSRRRGRTFQRTASMRPRSGSAAGSSPGITRGRGGSEDPEGSNERPTVPVGSISGRRRTVGSDVQSRAAESVEDRQAECCAGRRPHGLIASGGSGACRRGQRAS